MKERISWKVGLMVIVAAIPMVLFYAHYLPDLLVSLPSFTFIVSCILYSSLVIRGMIWMCYNKEQSISHNLQRLAGYFGIYMAAFVVGGLLMGVQGRDLLLLIVTVALYSTVYAFNALKYVFRQGWDVFLTIMIIPAIVVVWLIMINKGVENGQNLYELYNALIIMGISYWLLIGIVLLLFSRHILKHSNNSSV